MFKNFYVVLLIVMGEVISELKLGKVEVVDLEKFVVEGYLV